MSTNARPPSDPTDRDPADPYGIIPEGFLAAYNASSIPEALRKAERAPSTTNPFEQRRCPACGSTKVIPKTGHREMPQKRETEFKCGECPTHFDSPRDSKLAEAKQRAAECRDRPSTAERYAESEQAGLDEVVDQ